MKAWQILNSNITILIVGFILTTIVGKYLSTYLQKKSWERQTKIDLFQKKYENGTKFLEELSKMIGTRLFLLQKLFWKIEEGDEEQIKNAEKDYFAIVNSWNTEYFTNRNKVRLLVGEEMANNFLDYNDDNKENPKSVHYKFVGTHQIVLMTKKDKYNLKDAKTAINELNWKCSSFLEDVTSEFTNRAERLLLLDVTKIKKKQSNK